MISITFDYITASRALKLPCFEKVKRSNIYFYLYLLSPQLVNYGKKYNKICVYIPTLRQDGKRIQNNTSNIFTLT